MLCLHVAAGWMTYLYMRCCFGQQWFKRKSGQRVIKFWTRCLGNILGLRIRVRGCQATRTPTLYIANHISWLDIVALSATIESRFIAKIEVKNWPVVGKLVCGAGTLFIDRSRRSAAKQAVSDLVDVLSSRDSVVVFPEGTTTTGFHVKPFHGGLFQAAIDSCVLTQVVALSYQRNGEVDLISPFVADDTLPRHLFRILAQAKTEVTIQFGAVTPAKGQSRREMAASSHRQICSLLDLAPDAQAA